MIGFPTEKFPLDQMQRTDVNDVITDKLLDRALLRFAPRSTVLPAWLAPLAAKRSVASLPHNATGHTWLQLVPDIYKFHTGWHFSALAVS